MITPFFGRREVPPYTKIGLGSLIAFLVYPMVDNVDFSPDLWITFIMIIRESAVGMAMGFICFMFFSALYVAGGIIDVQMGFGIVNVIDPQNNSPVPLVGNFYYILSLLLFLTVNGHHVLISALIKSYEVLPLKNVIFGERLLESIVAFFVQMFVLGLKIALPVVSMVLVVDIALGIIARTVPQINVFIVGLPLKIAAGMVGMIIVMPLYVVALDVLFNGIYHNLFTLLKGMLALP